MNNTSALAYRKNLRSLLYALLLTVSGSCMAAYNVWTGDYTFTRRELQTALATQFPRTLHYLNIFDVSLSHPQLTFDPDNNRVITTVDAQINNALLMTRPLNGKLSMSSALKYDPATRALRLDAPAVENIDIAGMPAQYATQLNALGNTVAREMLNDHPLYVFSPEQLEMNGQRFEPDTITVLSDGIKVGIRQQ